MGTLLHPLVYQQQSSQSAKMNDKQTETLHLRVPRTAKNFSGSEVSSFPFSPHEGTNSKYFRLCEPHGPQHKQAALLRKPGADMVWLGLAYRLWLSKPNFQACHRGFGSINNRAAVCWFTLNMFFPPCILTLQKL